MANVDTSIPQFIPLSHTFLLVQIKTPLFALVPAFLAPKPDSLLEVLVLFSLHPQPFFQLKGNANSCLSRSIGTAFILLDLLECSL